MAGRLTLSAALVVALALAPGARGAEPAAQPVRPAKPAAFKHQDVDVAWTAAQKTKRPMLLFVSAADCRFCTKMVNETYSHPHVARALAASCETTRVSREQRPDLVRRLRVRAYPTTIVIAPDGKELGRIEGFLNAKKFAARMFGTPEQGAASAAARAPAPPSNVAAR